MFVNSHLQRGSTKAVTRVPLRSYLNVQSPAISESKQDHPPSSTSRNPITVRASPDPTYSAHPDATPQQIVGRRQISHCVDQRGPHHTRRERCPTRSPERFDDARGQVWPAELELLLYRRSRKVRQTFDLLPLRRLERLFDCSPRAKYSRGGGVGRGQSALSHYTTAAMWYRWHPSHRLLAQC